MGEPVKIKPLSQEMCEVFARMQEHPGEVLTPKGDVIHANTNEQPGNASS
jgi:hypothetical protein